MKLSERIDDIIEDVEDDVDRLGGILPIKKKLNEAKKQAESLESQTRWIPVEEGLPEVGDKVLIIQNPHTSSTRKPLFSWFDGKYFRPPRPDVYLANGDIGTSKWADITHWQPLPEPPK